VPQSIADTTRCNLTCLPFIVTSTTAPM